MYLCLRSVGALCSLVVGLSVCQSVRFPSANTYFAWCDISLFTGFPLYFGTVLKFKYFSMTFKDPEVAFSRTNSRRKFTVRAVFKAIFNIYFCDYGTIISKSCFRQNTCLTKLPISRNLTWWIQGLSRTCGMKFKDFQAPVLFSSTSKALNLGEKIQVLSRTFKDAWEPCTWRCISVKLVTTVHRVSWNCYTGFQGQRWKVKVTCAEMCKC